MTISVRRVVQVGAFALLLALAIVGTAPQPSAAQDDYRLIEARITAERQDDGRVRVALEIRRGDTGWGERLDPQRRYLGIDTLTNEWRYSEALPPIEGVPGRIRIAARRITYGHVELALQRDLGLGWSRLLRPRARQLDSVRYGPDRFATSSIDLVDDGPQRCRLGLVLKPGDQCRFPDTRELLVIQPDGVARYPIDPWNALGLDHDDGVVMPNESQYFVVPFLHGTPEREDQLGVWLESLADGEYLIRRFGRDRLFPVNSAVCAAGLLVPFGHYCNMPAGYVWFIVYPRGPAHLNVTSYQLNWVSQTDLRVEITPRGNVGRHTVHAARETDGWRITTLEAPDPPVLPFPTTDIGPCVVGILVRPGESCSDPTSSSTFWVDDLGHWGWDDIPFGDRDIGGRKHGNLGQDHPYRHSFGFLALSDNSWLIHQIAGLQSALRLPSGCRLGLLVYPGETCDADGSWFWVFADGLAAYHNTADRERVHVEDHRGRYASGEIVRSHDFTAELDSFGGFRIVHMQTTQLEP